MTVSVLYSRDILRLACALIPDDRIENLNGTAEARSPACGSRILAEVALNAEACITDIAFRASACALGQASAAVVRANAAGHSHASITDIRGSLADCLQNNAAAPAIWPQLALFESARDFPGRHAAILLPYDALLLAIEQAS